MDTRDGCNFKVVLLGEGCVGKTSIVLRFVEGKFEVKTFSTLQASFLHKTIQLNGKKVNLNIWDTAGQERFHALGPIYYRSANGAILVYDITDEDSFMKVKTWVKELKKMLGSKVVIIIAANKIDLNSERNVSIEEGTRYSEDVGAKHFETSAKINVGIEELFVELAKDMIESAQLENERISNATNRSHIGNNSNSLIVDDTDTTDNDITENRTSKCCT